MIKEIVIEIDDKANLPFTQSDLIWMKEEFSKLLEFKYFLEITNIKIKNTNTNIEAE